MHKLGMPRTRERKSRSQEATPLKRVRALLDLSQRELALEFRVGAAAIALWESGARTMPGPALRLLEMFEAELGMQEPESAAGRARGQPHRFDRAGRPRDVLAPRPSVLGDVHQERRPARAGIDAGRNVTRC
jgi:transcriptional regulator with XRE-family HTH domain